MVTLVVCSLRETFFGLRLGRHCRGHSFRSPKFRTTVRDFFFVASISPIPLHLLDSKICFARYSDFQRFENCKSITMKFFTAAALLGAALLNNGPVRAEEDAAGSRAPVIDGFSEDDKAKMEESSEHEFQAEVNRLWTLSSTRCTPRSRFSFVS